MSLQLAPSSPLTRAAYWLTAATTALTAAFLLGRYPALPWLLPVHFMANGVPNGWQFRTLARVFAPVFVQIALTLSLGPISMLLRSRGHDRHDPDGPDVQAARIASEAVATILAVWVIFQAYAATAIVAMWMRQREGLGWAYTPAEVIGALASVAIAARAMRKIGRPSPKPFRAEHWRLGQLYHNPDDPALFVPTRDGSRWTLNFGRPVAALLMGIILVFGMLGPTTILALVLRYRF